MQTPSFIEVPAFQNILQYTVDFIFEKHARLAPDFSDLYVLLPHSQLTRPFNETLCRSLVPESSASAPPAAIIPPWAGTLKSWASHFVANENPDYQIIGEQARQLLFIEALIQHPDLFNEENKWQVSQALLKLFDELTLNQKNFFGSTEKWQNQLQQAYGIEQPNQHLLHESKLVYTLWHAWQTQLTENCLYDETGDYLSRLNNAHSVIKQQHFICLGLSNYCKTEHEFIQQLIDKQQCDVIDFASTITASTITASTITDGSIADDTITDGAASNETVTGNQTFAAFINETFRPSTTSFKQRAKNFADQFPEHFSKKAPFATYLANNEEAQVRAIDFNIRHNLLNNKTRIAIISEDRKLSRRLRALLERANIPLQDKAGWSLATTQASTIIERWLECIEEDFNAYPLLDCLKSPFINFTDNEENFKNNVYRFEHDLIFYENISSNINQYKKQLKKRLKRLSHWPENTYKELTGTLNFIADTAKPLTHLHSKKNIALSDFLQALLNSLQQLGVIQCYQNDEAGLVLLASFEELKQSVKQADPELSWQDCRLWLAMALESQHFTPPTNNTGVQLITLEQSAYQTFDCIIIAATEPQHFPGSAKNSPFFNQAVRASLELNTWEQQHQQRHELFNRVLLSAPDILLTACAEEKGEEKPVSPWLELLINFYQLAYQQPDKKTITTEDQYLHQLVQSKSEVFNDIEPQLPRQTVAGSPVLPVDLLPQRISASAYQRIINCPYQYFSADGLHLKALEELSDELKKANYGERIHLILQCFHNGHDFFGKAFTKTINENNREQTENQLAEISDKVFLKDLENNVLHRSWLHRWKKHIPAYINWQIQQQNDWDIFLSEKNIEVELKIDSATEQAATVKIYGRLDRIDKNKIDHSHAIIDYKTGRTASQEDVDNGENVQLGIYALLDNEATEVSYLSVDSSYQKVERKSFLSGEELTTNREQNSQRLIELFKQMKNQQALPAWGDESVCKFCSFSGLCRKDEYRE